VYAVQLDMKLSGPLDQNRLRDAVHTVVNRHPNLAARFSDCYDEPVQIILADPSAAWQYVELDPGMDVEEQIQQLCAAERAAVCDLANPPAFRVAVIRTAADRHRLVLTNHHILMDGWSLQILLREIFVSYYGHRLSAPVSYRRFVSWLAGRDVDAARAAWGEVLAGFDTPTLVGPPDRLGIGPRDVRSFRLSEEITRALGELARPHHTTVSTVLQAAFAQVLCALTGQRDIVFGAVVSMRPAEVVGADSMVGLMINTVPVRANITPTTTTKDLLEQLQGAHNHTLDHQHVALSDIHRITGQERLFDTVFVFENYPTGAAASENVDELVITEANDRDYYHYPLTIQAAPGRELELRLQFRTDVFDAATVEALIEQFERVLVAMTSNPTRQLSTSDLLGRAQTQPTTAALAPENHDTGDGYRAPASLAERILAGIYAHVLGVDRVGVDESFFDLGGNSLSAMRAIAAINTAFDINLAVNTFFDASSVRSLSQQLANASNR
jgi:acyl carrier protein